MEHINSISYRPGLGYIFDLEVIFPLDLIFKDDFFECEHYRYTGMIMPDTGWRAVSIARILLRNSAVLREVRTI